MEQATHLEESSARSACPLSALGVESQIIRRKDLVDLGESFKEALGPLQQLVEHLREQTTAVGRLQVWIILSLVMSCISLAVMSSLLYAVNEVEHELVRARGALATRR